MYTSQSRKMSEAQLRKQANGRTRRYGRTSPKAIRLPKGDMPSPKRIASPVTVTKLTPEQAQAYMANLKAKA
jgi:hypothetical protein